MKNLKGQNLEMPIKGHLDVAITGTVTVAALSNAVAGVGTSFTTELAVGVAIMIAGEKFSVASITDDFNLTLNGNHVAGAAGVAAYKDGDLFVVHTGAGSQMHKIDYSGKVTFRTNIRQTFSPGVNAAGFNMGSVAVDPDTPLNGDMWYNTTDNVAKIRVNGTSALLGGSPAGSGTELQYRASANSFGAVTSSYDGETLTYNPTLTGAAGSKSALIIAPTINQSATAGYEALAITVTETAVGSGVKRMITARVGGNYVFDVSSLGYVGIGSGYESNVKLSVISTLDLGLKVWVSGFTVNESLDVAEIRAEKTTDMGDGFGPRLGFSIKDDTATGYLGYIGAVRAGADNTGDLIFSPVLAGTITERLRVGSKGVLTSTSVLNLASGDETGLAINTTVNKAAGTSYALKINVTDTVSGDPIHLIYSTVGTTIFDVSETEIKHTVATGINLTFSASGLKINLNSDTYVESSFKNSGTADTVVQIAHNNATQGDPHLFFEGNTARWSLGIDKTDNQKLKLTTSTAPDYASPSTGTVLFDLTQAKVLNLYTATLNIPDGEFNVTDSRSDSVAIVDFSNTNATSGVVMIARSYHNGANNYIQFYGNTSRLDFGISGSGILTLANSQVTILENGNAGFGITPATKLHVYNSTDNATIATIEQTSSTTGIEMLKLINRNTGATSTSVLGFRLYTDAPAEQVAGKILVGKEALWTSTASTQDSYMGFHTSLDGAVVEKMRITSAGYLGLSTTSPAGRLDISDGNVALIVGADLSTTTRTDATQKVYRIGCYHYTNAEEPMTLLTGSSGTSTNVIRIGGGTGIFNTATDIIFYTASTTTTLTGTIRMAIESGGNVVVGSGASQSGFELTVYDDVYCIGTMSALVITDRTPYPKSLKEAYDAVGSLIGDNEGSLDHTRMHSSLRATKKKVVEGKEVEVYQGRNLSALVSAQNEVIKDLLKRIKLLEQ